MIDFATLASLPKDQALALLNKQFGKSNYGPINWQSQEGAGGDLFSFLADAQGNRYDWNQATRPEYTDAGGNGWNLGNATFDRALTTTGTSTADPTQYGHYKGVYDSQGNLVNVEWVQEDKSSGWFMDNLETIGPLIVGGAMAAGAGGFLPDFSQGANLSSSIGTTDLLGGAASDTLGAATAESLLSQAPAYDSLVSGAMPQSIAGSGIGAGIGANGVAGAIDAASTIGPGAAAVQAGSAILDGVTTSDLIKAGAAVAGAAASGSTQGGTTTTNKEPWEPTQETLKKIVEQFPSVMDWYTKNPFNAQQKAGYENLFSQMDNINANVAPGLMNFANSAASAQHVRAPRVDPSTYRMPTINAPFAGFGTGQPDQPAQTYLPVAAAQSSAPAANLFSWGATTPFGKPDWLNINPFASGKIPGIA